MLQTLPLEGFESIRISQFNEDFKEIYNEDSYEECIPEADNNILKD